MPFSNREFPNTPIQRAVLAATLCLIGVAVTCVGGCLEHPAKARPSSVLAERLRPKTIDPGPDGLFMDVIYLERPFGDTELNRELWAPADAEVADIEKRRVLEEHGFRVAVLGGQLPAVIKQLFHVDELAPSESGHLLMQSGNPTTIQTSGDYPSWPEAGPDGTPKYVNAAGVLRAVPRITPDGCVKLAIYPEIQHGNVRREFVPTAEPRGAMDWTIKVGRQTKPFDALNFSLTLRAGQYLMLSCDTADAESLGARFFTRVKDGRTLQRVIMIEAEPSRSALAARGKL